MKTAYKIGLLFLLLITLGIGARFYFLTLGLSKGNQIIINEVDLSKVEDGLFVGSYDVGRWSNEIIVKVKDHSIIEIQIIKPTQYEDPLQTQELIQRILDQQTMLVDVVSGATVTSKAYLKSVENALTQND